MIPLGEDVRILYDGDLALDCGEKGKVFLNKVSSKKTQYWKIIEDVDGSYSIRNCATYGILVLKEQKVRQYDGPITTWDKIWKSRGTSTRKWRIEDQQNSYFAICPAMLWPEVKFLQPMKKQTGFECKVSQTKTYWNIQKVSEANRIQTKEKDERKHIVGFEGLNEKLVFKTAVVATMSAGKSTLINALAGRELLPSLNQACTARTLALLDNDRLQGVWCSLMYRNGMVTTGIPCKLEDIQALNRDKTQDVKDIIVECNLEGIHNVGRALMMIDTPGINNNLDASHAQVTKDYVKSMHKGLLLYMMNANQPATDDDSKFLSWIAKNQKENPERKIIFVLNKIDEVDPEVESIEEMIESLVDYIKKKGIERPILLPVSAQAALLFKKVLSGQELTRVEIRHFYRYYMEFNEQEKCSMDCRSLLWDDSIRQKSDVNIGGQTYACIEIYNALEQTGIPTLERLVERELLLASAGENIDGK